MRTKPTLHRSIGFWLGCLVLAFLMWVWVDSYKTATRVFAGVYLEETGVPWRGFSAPGGPTQVFCPRMWVLENGLVTVDYTAASNRSKNVMVSAHEGSGFGRIGASPGPLWSGFRVEKAEREVQVKIAQVTRYQVEVPMWGIVGLYGVVFLMVMMWWRRRMMRGWVEKMREEVRGMNAGR